MATKSAAFTTFTTASKPMVVSQKFKKKKKASSSRNNIKIKPFSTPPKIPPNFYNDTTTVLFNSLRDILNQKNTNNISREDLYKKVTDLCLYGFGSRLYLELVGVLDDAAKVCLSRLAGLDADDGGIDTGHGNNICYSTPHCFRNNDHIFFKSIQEINVEPKSGVYTYGTSPTKGTTTCTSDEDSLLLGNIWKVYSDYVQYLNCVRLIFQSLDRMFLYLPPSPTATTALEREARIVARNDGSKMMSECATNGMTIGTWNMLDVGINCMYKHMANINVAKNSSKDDSDTVMDSTAAVASDGSIATLEESVLDKIGFSALDVLKQRTIACLIEELRVSLPSSSSDTTKATELYHHQSIIRNCILIFRTFNNVSIHPTNTMIPQQSIHYTRKSIITMGVMDNFLQGLVAAMTSFFSKESKSLMHLDDLSIDNTTDAASEGLKTSYDTKFILHHVDSRLKQVNGMTTYYTLSTTTTWSSSSKYIPLNKQQDGYFGGSSRNDNKILSLLVETQLLTPHFTTKYILHPANLHPILDDKDDQQSNDVKLLFQLSKRVHTNDDSSGLQEKNINAIPNLPGMELLRISFQYYANERGLSIMRPNVAPIVNVTQGTGPVKPPPSARDVQNQVVSNLLNFKSHLEQMVMDSFGSNEYFIKTLKKVLEDVLNQGGEAEASQQHDVMSTTNRRKKKLFGHSDDGYDGGKRIAELLAKYIDMKFKNTKGGVSSSPTKGIRANNISIEDDVEAFQAAVIDLFRHIQSKDVFEAFYRRDLSKRLLSNKSASIDYERRFLSKLKAECGPGYTAKMEGMFKDMDLSRDVMGNYSAYLGGLEDVSSGSYSNLSGENIDMDIQVLTTGYWPVQAKHSSLILPDSLESRKNHFESYYLSKYQGRRISWQNSLGNCIVKANFPKVGQRELNVSLLQALALNCFNVEEGSNVEPALTIIDVMKKTGLQDRGETERVLQSLCMGREGTQVLRRVEESDVSKDTDGSSSTPKKKHKISRKAISDNDVFMFNADFFTTQRRIRITNIQMKETPEENSKTNESVMVDRLYLVDAAIVRTMKARKTLDHRSLVGEVMKQLKFPASGTDIKKQIEKLIDRDYLERVDSSNYKYLA